MMTYWGMKYHTINHHILQAKSSAGLPTGNVKQAYVFVASWVENPSTCGCKIHPLQYGRSLGSGRQVRRSMSYPYFFSCKKKFRKLNKLTIITNMVLDHNFITQLFYISSSSCLLIISFLKFKKQQIAVNIQIFLHTEEIWNNAAITEPASGTKRVVYAIRRMVGRGESYDVVVVPHIHKGVTKDETRTRTCRRHLSRGQNETTLIKQQQSYKT